MIQTNRNAYSTRQTQVWAISITITRNAVAVSVVRGVVCMWCIVVMPRWFFSVKWFIRGVKINSCSLSLMLWWHRIVHMNLNTPAEPQTVNAASQMPWKICVSSYHTLDYVKCQQFQSLVTPNSQRVAYTETF